MLMLDMQFSALLFEHQCLAAIGGKAIRNIGLAEFDGSLIAIENNLRGVNFDADSSLTCNAGLPFISPRLAAHALGCFKIGGVIIEIGFNVLRTPCFRPSINRGNHRLGLGIDRWPWRGLGRRLALGLLRFLFCVFCWCWFLRFWWCF